MGESTTPSLCLWPTPTGFTSLLKTMLKITRSAFLARYLASKGMKPCCCHHRHQRAQCTDSSLPALRPQVSILCLQIFFKFCLMFFFCVRGCFLCSYTSYVFCFYLPVMGADCSHQMTDFTAGLTTQSAQSRAGRRRRVQNSSVLFVCFWLHTDSVVAMLSFRLQCTMLYLSIF